MKIELDDDKNEIMTNTLVPYTKFKSGHRDRLGLKPLKTEGTGDKVSRRLSRGFSFTEKNRKPPTEVDEAKAKAEANGEEKTERRRLMDWEKHYGYEEDSEDSEEDEVTACPKHILKSHSLL